MVGQKKNRDDKQGLTLINEIYRPIRISSLTKKQKHLYYNHTVTHYLYNDSLHHFDLPTHMSPVILNSIPLKVHSPLKLKPKLVRH